jgi:hypothetical protein
MFAAYGFVALSLGLAIAFSQVNRHGCVADILCILSLGLVMSGVTSIWASFIILALRYLP